MNFIYKYIYNEHNLLIDLNVLESKNKVANKQTSSLMTFLSALMAEQDFCPPHHFLCLLPQFVFLLIAFCSAISSRVRERVCVCVFFSYWCYITRISVNFILTLFNFSPLFFF